MKHVDLLQEVSKNVKFNASNIQKKQVESLLNREFLERDPEDPNTYVYVAIILKIQCHSWLIPGPV